MRTARESLIIGLRNNKKVARVPFMLFLAIFQPLLFLVLFTQIFKELGNLPAFQAEGYDSYLMFFAPTILTLTMLISAFQSGMGMVTDLDQGMLDKMLISPIHRSSILFGKVMSDATRMLIQGVVVLCVAILMGAHVETGFLGAVVILAVAVTFGVTWAGLSNIIALRTRNWEMTMVIGILFTFPMLFLSPSLMPQALLPDWLETVGKFNPVTYVVECARVLMNTGWDWTKIWQALGVSAVVGAVTLPLAVRAFRKAMN